MNQLITSAKNIIFIIILICAQIISGYSQDHQQPPIPAELLLGHEALYSQLVLSRDFSQNSKFSFFSLATYSAYYNEQEDNDLAIINQLSYRLGKGFGLFGGFNINAAVGLAPILGPEHIYASRKFLAISRLSYALNGEHDLGFFGLYEFKPPINDKLALYTRLQVLYERGLSEGQHNRSFLYLRAGLKKNQFNFGLGANLDQYGPQKEFKPNYGVFLAWEF
jgi:hypothetical protein